MTVTVVLINTEEAIFILLKYNPQINISRYEFL